MATTDLEQIQPNDLHGKASISVAEHLSQTFPKEMDLQSLILQINPEKQSFMTTLVLVEICQVSEKEQGPQSWLSGRIAHACQVNSEHCRTLYDPDLRVFRHRKSGLCTAVSKFDLCHLYLSKSLNLSCPVWPSSQANFGF